ncbi:RagB/SusD family nutrient uptake outer membrane protein [Marinigracilibium pacificum]|uniref:RagB/SusD family nutrient uptake outer membrane protein n=1 Tax=Marinigracilibium pacificum TaxID=2729599 RepID=A0A848J1S3_9BACT|nr:RagB/SusD family nutrient uptake outer membrane protein [Marinigracilibium pacificum]NMM48490.1 RagB/SusD family nutrient uptake outer membrane protein [Marinigracilibium pacificum]
MKTINKLSTYILVAITLLSFQSCEDFLDQEIPGRAPVEEFYQTEEDVMQATTAAYDILQYHYSNGWASPYLVKTLPSDESTAGGGGFGDQPAYQTLHSYTFDSNNDAIFGLWKMAYYGIYRANLVINNTEPDTDLKKRLVAEAKCLRAYFYFELVSLFGDVPLVLTEIPPAEYTSTPRTPANEVYDQIEIDLNDAIAVLPPKSAYGSADKFRWTVGSAQALLGKAYLYQEEWTNAASNFDDVIASGEYSLEPYFGQVFSNTREFGMESVLEVQFVNTEGYNWGNFPWGEGRAQENNIHIQLMGPRDFTQAPGDSLIAGWGFNIAEPNTYQAFIDAGDTERRVNTVMSYQELVDMGGDIVQESHQFKGYIRRKYGTYQNETSTENGGVNELNYGTNWRLIRYSDVLLMAAEAHIRMGDEATGVDLINEVRNRAGLADISASGAALIDALIMERRLELVFEGHRFRDLVRWGIADQVLAPEGFVAGKHELLPIPISEVRTAGLTQNPNW